MKRFFTLFAAVFTVFSNHAFAHSGGPFDNGLQSATLDRGAFYQAILSFPNGSGYLYFAPVQNLAANGTVAGAGTTVGGAAVAVDTRGSTTNRSVLYYKGLTYVGSAFGTADYEARSITGTLNAATNAAQSQLTNSTQNNANNPFSSTGAAANANAISTTLIANPFSFVANGNFTAHIDQMAPTMRFSGTGEISFIAPNQKDAQAGLAYTGFSGLVNAIITAVGNANVGAVFSPAVFTQAQTAIASAVAALPPLTSIDQAYAAGQLQKLTVRGTRRYL